MLNASPCSLSACCRTKVRSAAISLSLAWAAIWKNELINPQTIHYLVHIPSRLSRAIVVCVSHAFRAFSMYWQAI